MKSFSTGVDLELVIIPHPELQHKGLFHEWR